MLGVAGDLGEQQAQPAFEISAARQLREQCGQLGRTSKAPARGRDVAHALAVRQGIDGAQDLRSSHALHSTIRPDQAVAQLRRSGQGGVE